MSTRFIKYLLPSVLSAAVIFPLAVNAQTVTPTSPQGWALDAGHTQGGGTAQISTDQPRSGNGSLELAMPDGSAAAAYALTFAPVSLGSFSSASFDWYRSSTSMASAQLAPVFAFDIAYTDKASNTTTFGQIEWESVYNGVAVAPTDAWQSPTLTNGSWWVQGGLFGQSPSDRGPLNTDCGSVNRDGGSQAFMTIADWATSSCLANAVVYGVNVQVGSGWSGSFLGDVDNVDFAFTGGPSGAYNFEADGPTSTVPEPASLTLLATGLAGVIGMRRRRSTRNS